MQKQEIEEKKESELSFIQVLKVMFGRKVFMLLVCVSFLVVSNLIFGLKINKNNATYSCDFTYNSSYLNSGYYYDGSMFSYLSIISYENLSKVKELKDEYSNINVENIIENEAISIIPYLNGENVYYSLSIKKKYFPNYSVAKHFLEDLSSYPTIKLINSCDNINYMFYIESYETANKYDEKIALLEKQYSFILSSYEQLIDEFGDKITDGVKTSYYLENLKIQLDESDFKELYNQLNLYGFVLSNTELYSLKFEKESLSNEKAELEIKINSLLDLINEISNKAGSNVNNLEIATINEQVLAYKNSIDDINIKLDTLNLKIANIDRTDEDYISKKNMFESKLESFHISLSGFTNEYELVNKNTVEESIGVNYINSNLITLSGEISLIIVSLVAIFIGIMSSCVITLIIDHKKLLLNELDTKDK